LSTTISLIKDMIKRKGTLILLC